MRKLKNILLVVIWTVFFFISADARPGRNGIYTVSQPDGSKFTMITYGDEFYNISKTSDGYAVMCNTDNWWYYAIVNENGGKTITDWKVGSKAPADILSASKNIPNINRFAADKARKARSLHIANSDLFSRIKTSQGTKAEGAVTQKHGIVLLAEFQDVKFKYSKQEFESLLTEKGYNRHGATGCAKEYFESQFGSSYEFDFVVSDIITLNHPRAYYGGNNEYDQDSAPELMVVEACQGASAQGIDFSIFDQDNDNEVDNVFVIFAGEDEADYGSDMRYSDCIWSHAWFIKDGAGIDLQLNGKVINRYACTSELKRTNDDRKTLTGIGTFCHEYSHTFGLPDYYDTDYEKSNGMSGAMWSYTALMDGGNTNNNANTPPFFNAIDREILGIGEAVKIRANGTYTMKPIGEGGTFYRIDTDHEDEYYLLECRYAESWDKYIGGSGMLIYHIDKSNRNTGTSEVFGKEVTALQRWLEYNEVNAYPQRQCADLIEADGRIDKFNSFNAYVNNLSDISKIFYPQRGSTDFSANSRPAMKFWSGAIPKVAISNITRDGKTISFYITGFEGLLPTPTIDSQIIFQNAAIIGFSSDIPDMNAKANISWGETDKEVNIVEIDAYSPGKYCLTLENLKPATSYEMKISFKTDKGIGKEISVHFITSRYNKDSYPFISLKSIERNEDGSFKSGCKLPLRVWNAIDAAEINWFYNDKSITTALDGFYSPQESGELKAVINWKEGGEDIIVKNIIIRK